MKKETINATEVEPFVGARLLLDEEVGEGVKGKVKGRASGSMSATHRIMTTITINPKVINCALLGSAFSYGYTLLKDSPLFLAAFAAFVC